MIPAEGGGIRVRAIAVVVKGFGAIAVCKKCKSDVSIPLRLSTDLFEDHTKLIVPRENKK